MIIIIIIAVNKTLCRFTIDATMRTIIVLDWQMVTTKINQAVDIVIVGAGPAGVGCGIVLKELGIENFTILERHQVGASFILWPEKMRFITPSFPSHGFGLLDLNAITRKTSPALAFGQEHLTGQQYAVYLKTVADYFELPVQTETEVKEVTPLSEGKGDFRWKLLKVEFSPNLSFGQQENINIRISIPFPVPSIVGIIRKSVLGKI